MPGRDTTSFLANFTASLRICHKNAMVNERSVFAEFAGSVANSLYDHVISPTVDYAYRQAFHASKATEQNDAPPKALTKKEIKTRQIVAESDSTELNRKLEALESQIRPLIEQKKQLDAIEQKNKERKLKPYLNEQQQHERLELLKRIDGFLLEKVILCEGLIEEHVMRRLDITFLLMIAIYKQNVSVSKGSTDRQHGIGKKKEKGTAACHPSLVPHPILEPIHISSTAYNTSKNFTLYQQFFGHQPPNLMINEEKLKNCYLYDLLNMTTELPIIVNEFDGHMEGKWIQSNAVESVIQILNRVSEGSLTPIEGVNKYAEIMHLFFNHMQYKYMLTEPTYTTVQAPDAFEKVWQFQRRATFAMFHKVDNNQAEPHFQINSLYLNNMLKLHEISPPLRHFSTYQEQQFSKIQQEIWQQPSLYSESLSQKKHNSNFGLKLA